MHPWKPFGNRYEYGYYHNQSKCMKFRCRCKKQAEMTSCSSYKDLLTTYPTITANVSLLIILQALHDPIKNNTTIELESLLVNAYPILELSWPHFVVLEISSAVLQKIKSVVNFLTFISFLFCRSLSCSLVCICSMQTSRTVQHI